MNVSDKAAFLDSICTCKTCDNHRLTRNCIDAKCVCCTESNHSMILDGIEGFIPEEVKKANV